MKQNIIVGQREIDSKKIGDIISVTDYRPARVGYGMDRYASLQGKLIAIINPEIKCYGCSFTWAAITIDTDVYA